MQYFGTQMQNRSRSFDLLAPLLNITTTLDPKLVVAYRFGAVFLAEHPPGGAGRPDLAVDLVKKGIAGNPDEWELYYDLGLLYYTHLKDYQKAYEAFLDGSKNPAAPMWMKIMAARVAENGESLETSRLIWAELYNSTKDESVRQRALLHVQALDAQIALKKLNESSEDYWKKFGRFPTSIQELRDAGLVQGDLKDPAGYPYVMGPNGVPQLDPHSPVPVESESAEAVALNQIIRSGGLPPGFRRAAFVAGQTPKMRPMPTETAEADNDGPRRNDGLQRTHQGDQQNDPAPHQDADDAAGAGESHGFEKKLPGNVLAARPDRLAHADLARALGDGDQHDVHHAHSADQQANRAEHDHGEHDAADDVVELLHHLDLRLDGKIVRFVVGNVAAAAQHFADLVHGRVEFSG